MKEPRVKKIISEYKHGNLAKVYEYLTEPNMVVDPSTWCGQIKKMIEDKNFESAKQLIEITGYKFIYNLKNFNNE